MKKQTDSLQKIIDQLNAKVELADEKFNQRSERWQESERGLEAESEMQDLEMFIDTLESAKLELEEL